MLKSVDLTFTWNWSEHSSDVTDVLIITNFMYQVKLPPSRLYHGYSCYLCVWWNSGQDLWGSDSSTHYSDSGSNGRHNRCSDMIVCLCVISVCPSVHWELPKGVYLPWQKRGMGWRLRWKQACVATKDIVIMKAFEEPLVSNGLHSRRGNNTHFSLLPVKSMWEGGILGKLTLRVKLSHKMQSYVSIWSGESAPFCVTTISICSEPTSLVSLQQLSKKRGRLW